MITAETEKDIIKSLEWWWFAIEKNIDWLAIKNEYIGGNISQRKLAAAHNVPYRALRRVAEREGWYAEREEIKRKASAKAAQNIVDAKAENAALAEEIKHGLLLRLKQEVDNLPESNIGTESHQKEIHYSSDGSKREQSRVIKLRDLVASLKDLIDGDFRREKLDLDKKRAEDDW